MATYTKSSELPKLLSNGDLIVIPGYGTVEHYNDEVGEIDGANISYPDVMAHIGISNPKDLIDLVLTPAQLSYDLEMPIDEIHVRLLKVILIFAESKTNALNTALETYKLIAEREHTVDALYAYKRYLLNVLPKEVLAYRRTMDNASMRDLRYQCLQVIKEIDYGNSSEDTTEESQEADFC